MLHRPGPVQAFRASRRCHSPLPLRRLLSTAGRSLESAQWARNDDSVGRLTEFLDPQGGRTRYTFDPLSRITEIKYANDTVTRHTYDAGSRLTGIRAQGPKGDIVRYGYTYDPVGNPLERTEGLHAASRYTYDALDQLIQVEYPLEHILDIRANQPGCLPPVSAKASPELARLQARHTEPVLRVTRMAHRVMAAGRPNTVMVLPLVTGAALRVKTTHRVKATVLLVGTDLLDTAEALPGKDKARVGTVQSGLSLTAAPRTRTIGSATGSPLPLMGKARRMRTKG